MTIRTKILLISVIILFAAMGGNTLVTTTYFADKYLSARTSEVFVIAQTLKSQLNRLIKMHIPLSQLTGFEKMCQEAVSEHPAITYAMVVDTQGIVLFHNDPVFHGQKTDQVPSVKDLGKGGKQVQKTFMNHEWVYDFFIPVMENGQEPAAFVRVGFPVTHISSKTQTLALYSAAIALSSFVLGCTLLITLLNHLVIKPISQLTSAILDIKEKGFSAIGRRVDISSSDEIGSLAEAFNRMTEELRQTTISKADIENSLLLTQFAFDNVAIGIFHLAADGRIIKVNQQAADNLGYALDELTRMTVFDIDPDLTPEAFRRLWQRVLSTGYDNFERVHLDKNGRTIHVEVISNLIDYHGEQQSICFVKDITGQKQDEKEKKELEARLMQSQKMEAIGTLAGGIAHDFNNILSGMFGYCQLARRHMNDPEKTKRHIEQIAWGAQRATDLTKQILTFSRQGEYQKLPLKLCSEVEETLKLLRSSIPTTIVITTRITSRKKVLADPVKIHQLTLNLCTNAYHAMRKTGGELTVLLTDAVIGEKDTGMPETAAPGEYLRLDIGDTGHGMDKQTLQKAFDPYFTTKEKGEGTGLGLAIVRAIVEEHDGFLTVSSEPDKGTCFSLYFPALKENMPEPEPHIEDHQPLAGAEAIMVVDDDGYIRGSWGKLLEDYGYRVQTFKNGRDALGAFEADPDGFDVVITDMTMPELTGDKLAGKILEKRPDKPVVLCTGFSENITAAEAFAIGVKQFIQKPIQNRDLLVLIRKILDHKME